MHWRFVLMCVLVLSRFSTSQCIVASLSGAFFCYAAQLMRTWAPLRLALPLMFQATQIWSECFSIPSGLVPYRDMHNPHCSTLVKACAWNTFKSIQLLVVTVLHTFSPACLLDPREKGNELNAVGRIPMLTSRYGWDVIGYRR